MKEKLRDLIVMEAQSCFYLHGFKKTSVDEIVSHLRISKKTLYKYFISKDELIKAVIVRMMEPLITEIDSAIEKRSSIFDAVKGLYNFSQKLSANVSGPMLNDMRLMPDYWQVVEQERRKALGKLSIILKRAREDGIVKKDLDIELFVKILINTFDTFTHPNKLLEMGLTSSEFETHIFHIFMDGIMVDDGGLQNESTRI
jgi:AcrR family transcriptional regulator